MGCKASSRDCTNNIRGHSQPYKPEYWLNGTVPWIRTTEVQNCVLTPEDTQEFISELGLKNSSAKIVPAGTVLLAMIGQGKTRGQVSLLTFEATTNQNCSAIIFKNDQEPTFHFNFLLSQYENIRAMSNSAGQSNLSGALVKAIRVPVPPLPEQKKIAQILSTWDQAITTTEKLLANSQQQKKALMQQLLTGKKRLLDNNGVRFNSNWRKLKIQKIFTPSTEKAGNRPYRVYSVTKDGLIDQAEYFKKAVASEDTSTYRVIRKGQFIMSGLNFWMGSADVHSSSEPVKVSPAYKVFDISDSADVSFMKHFVRSTVFLRILVGSSIVGASVVRRNFSPDIFNSWVVELPNIDEQKKIAAVLSTADQEISALQQKLDALKQEKKALMQQLLTGKRRVTLN